METNAIAFVGLCDEFCRQMEGAREAERDEFIDSMLRLLPRIYISAFDISPDVYLDQEVYIDQALEEDYYDAVRRNVESLFGPDDVYLEVFEEDMKYSDTPVAVSISEGLADLFQVFYNFIESVKDAPSYLVTAALASLKYDFENYWSTTLCNVMRPLNHIKYNSPDNQYDDDYQD